MYCINTYNSVQGGKVTRLFSYRSSYAGVICGSNLPFSFPKTSLNLQVIKLGVIMCNAHKENTELFNNGGLSRSQLKKKRVSD